MKNFFIASVLLILFSFGSLSAGSIFYVSLTGTNTSPYDSWGTAANSIQDAVDAADSGDIIIVGNGTFVLSANIFVSKSITIKSLNGYMSTTISGSNAVRCLYVNDTGAIIEGFTIANGNNSSGYGGGIQCDNGTIRNCLIENNTARDGGGVALDNSGLVINCIIRKNTAEWGGGLRLFNGTVRNCLITENTANPHGGGINIWSRGNVQNCTITNNHASDGSGIRLWNHATVENSIIYFNTGSEDYMISEGNGNSLTYCCTAPLYTGTGNVDTDPNFVNLSASDFRLSASSPLINEGLNAGWMSSETDLNKHNRIIDETVDIGAYEYETFVIGGPVPIASWPVGGPVVYVNPPTLNWYLGLYCSGLTYEIQIKPASDASWPNTYLTSASMTYTLTYGLNAGVQYAWRVRSVTSATIKSNWSEPAFFTMVANASGTPIIPTISWPLGNPTVYNNPPILYWYLGAYAAGLTYEIQCMPALSADWPDAYETSSSMYYALTYGLTGGVQYTWRVRSVCGSVKSDWSTPAFFTMVANPSVAPVIPTLSWPIGNPTVYTNPPILYWYLGTYAPDLTYEVQYMPASNCVWPTEYFPTSSLYYTITTGLNWGVQYMWRVRSVCGSLKSDWSAPAYFTMLGNTSGTPVVPTLSWPVGNPTIYTPLPTLNWYLGTWVNGLTYQIQCKPSSQADWTNAFYSSPYTFYTFTSGLTEGVQYAWRVRSVCGSDTSDWSTPAYFTIISYCYCSPVQPLIGSPANLATIATGSPTLFWYLPAAMKFDATYEIQISENSDFQDPTILKSAKPSIQVSGLEGGKEYFWRVRSADKNGNASYFSGAGRFSVDNSVTGINKEKEIPESFALSQNFPNPFNPSTTIEFDIAKTGRTRLEVYNVLGQEVGTLVNTELAPGKYSVQFNAGKLSSGVYIFKITSGSFSSSKKMLLVK